MLFFCHKSLLLLYLIFVCLCSCVNTKVLLKDMKKYINSVEAVMSPETSLRKAMSIILDSPHSTAGDLVVLL